MLQTDDQVGKTGVPSEDAIRAFRARHREITFRNAENKDRSKFRGESFDHVGGFFKILKHAEKSNPGILSDGDRVWNMDETSISCEFGKRTKVFGSSQTHHGGFVESSTGSGSGTHGKAVIAVSASGRKTPPFFIVQGKKVITRWFDPLPAKSCGGHVLAENTGSRPMIV